jgi:hypothetical protein
MTIATAQISESLQILIDSRLDTIDRVLVGRVPRQDRLAIVAEVESQIHELLSERGDDDLTREDVLAALGRLDPPEAYLSDGIEAERMPMRAASPRQQQHGSVSSYDKVARASGFLGLAALALMLFMPVDYLIAVGLGSSQAAILLLGANLLLVVSAGVLGLTFGICARKGGPWAVVGITSGALSLLLSLAMIVVAVLLG